MVRGVLAVRIYYDDITMTPWADLRMVDGVVESICWTNTKQREEFSKGITGYTMFYDEREKCDWESWVPRA